MQYCPKCGARNPDENTQCAGCGASFSQFAAGPQAPQGPQGMQNPPPPQTPGYQPQGPPSYQPPAPPKPDNFLVWGILATVLCCLPAGIVSIVYSTKVDSLYYAGNYGAALDSAGKAKTWAIVSAVAGGLVGLFYVIAIALAGFGQSQM